jgi:hypothetical protein
MEFSDYTGLHKMTRYNATENGLIPFTAEQEAEWDIMVAEWNAGENSRKAAEVRAERNTKLAATDWTQAADVPQSVKDSYASYRQALRDVPQQAGFPENVQWPTQPE